MRRMSVAVVDEVGVVAMADGGMAAVRSVLVIVARMRHMGIVVALIPMVVMEPVGVAFMEVIGVVAVCDGDMAAIFAVNVFMGLVHVMSSGHLRRPPLFRCQFSAIYRVVATGAVGPRVPD
jgi:hypothetical protein